MDMRSIRLSLREYQTDYQVYPPSLDYLRKHSLKGQSSYLRLPSLLDPWGRQYEYRILDQHVIELWSCGPDGNNSGRRGDDIVLERLE